MASSSLLAQMLRSVRQVCGISCWAYVMIGWRRAQVFPAEPFNAEMDRLEEQGRGGWKGSQVKPALLPKDVDSSNTAFR